ncbi:hypothetical protein C1I98_23110 [Spongiactinospora gelatinilytica]|uniref:Uncharacterized protein n=1 Tax=Spongiactinospora gelatinilytica TaxID=2666298 RepID=A0A2W2GRB4_9ACTN|nr:hypothetical protein [Spongiactinospora gelatinilytica]PZG39838.1 hypothetical protein C1I98_23110 [Spongiactinospora gelatinilytica]
MTLLRKKPVPWAWAGKRESMPQEYLHEGRVCTGVTDRIGLFCLVPPTTGALTAAKPAAAVVLVWVAGGWRPRLSAIPHWWVCFSFSTSSNIIDGGDQVAAITSLLLIPICLTDGRRWHWNRCTAGSP